MDDPRTAEALERLGREARRIGDATLAEALRGLESAVTSPKTLRWVSAPTAAKALGVNRSTVWRWATACERRGSVAVRGGQLLRSDFKRNGRHLEVRLAAVRALVAARSAQ